MRTHRRCLSSSLLVASVLCGACSSTSPVAETKTVPPGAQATASNNESPPSGTSPADSTPTPDDGPSVWLPNSTGFELTETGNGPAVLPAEGSRCPDLTARWKYDVTSRNLTATGCDELTFKPFEDIVVLTPASAADLVVQISSLTSEALAPASACGTDGDEQTLTVINPGGPSSYTSDFDSNCPNAPAVPGPFVPSDALQTFTGYVDDYESACRSTDGGPPDSSRATCVTPIAYPVVDGSAPDGSPATDAPDASDGG
jgi:hypothetical protein